MKKPEKDSKSKWNSAWDRFAVSFLQTLIWPVAFSSIMFAAQPSVSVGSVSGGAGAAVDLPITFNVGSTGVSTLQFDLTLPSALSYVSITTGSAAAAAQKSASGSVIAGAMRVLVFGLNQNLLGSGSIATVRLNIAGGTASGGLTVGITGIVASDPAGVAVLANGSGGTVTVSTDTTAPTISGVGASSITGSGATITWTTNEASNSQVEYGATTSYGSSTSMASALVTSHSVNLSGLQPSNLYHYRVKSRDAANNLATSADFTFTTSADTTAPTISGVGTSSITGSGATINWTTNEASNSQVEYGATTSYGSSTPLASGLVTSHSVSLSGLQAGTLYHYRVKSRDAANNLATSADSTFTTASDATAPTISGVSASSITSSGATINWTTNEASNSQVEYGATTGYGSSTPLASGLVTSHSVSLSGLQAGTLYHYRVKSRDASNNLVTSADFSFTTAPDNTAPTISGVGTSSITGSGATIIWTTNEASDTQVEYGTTTGYGTSTPTVSALVTSHSVSLSGLQTSTLYHYRVKSRDASGNLATSSDFSFTISIDKTAPIISLVGASSITSSSVDITWTTDEPSDTQLQYGANMAYGTWTPLKSQLLTGHTVSLSGLKASTLYHYQVRSRDASGNLATSADFTFSTVNDNSTPGISSVGASSITATSATINWVTDKATDSQVEYGTADAYSNSTGILGTLVTTHAVVLSNLQPSKTYHYRVKSRDAGGNLAASSDQTFTTAAASNNVFTKITLSSVGKSSVTIDWSTSKPTSGLIEYGPAAVSDYRTSDLAITTKHVTQLNGLLPSTLYHYRITATPIDNNSVVSAILTFKTSDQLNQQAKPSSEAVFIPSIVENTEFRTNLGINNPGTSTANVSITLVDKQGMVLGTRTLQVNPKGLKQINNLARSLLEDNLGNGIEGSLYLESDQPISAWASQIENTTNDPSLLIGKRSGATKLLIPSAANAGSFNSSLVIMNVGTGSAQVNLKVYDVGGSVLGQTSIPLSIDPNGVLSFDNVLQTLGVNGKYGPLEITSVNNMPLIASSRVSSTTKTGGFFEGLKYSDASMIQIVPQIVDTDQLRTNIGINNVNAQPALVNVKLMNQDGVELATKEIVIPPNGLSQLNNVARQLLSQSAVSNFEGYIRLESNRPIFGWAAVIDNVSNDPGFAQGQKQGSTGVLVDSTANVGSFKSSLVIVNTGEEDAMVDIISHDITGSISGERRDLLIPARGYFSNTNILEHVGVQDNFGPLEVISTNGQPVIAASRVYSESGPSGFFQGQDVK